MRKRYMAIWFRHLLTDRWTVRFPELKDIPFVLAAPERGRMVITASNIEAEGQGIERGMVVADARAILPQLQVFDDKPELAGKLLHALAEWCIRYAPIVAVDMPDGIIMDITGCAHLWGGERAYLKNIVYKLHDAGYDVRAAISDTIGVSWAISRYGKVAPIIESGEEAAAISGLPPAALRLGPATLELMQKLGLYKISNFMDMPRGVLRRRFGLQLLDRLDQALGSINEKINPVSPIEPYQERLPSFEPIRTATGIEIALQKLLGTLCRRLEQESKGVRKAAFKCFRIDGNLEQIEIGTSSASCNVDHLFRLFQLKINTIRPALGIELFLLEAPVVEEMDQRQETLWNVSGNNDLEQIGELIDKMIGRAGTGIVHRYLPDQHHWPERSYTVTSSLHDKPVYTWRTDKPRPINILQQPELIQVTAPIPDYPPLLFRYKGEIHKVQKADGPERIEQEWWIEEGLHRDYYAVEDQHGARYWIFRSGHYGEHNPDWFLHGFFA